MNAGIMRFHPFPMKALKIGAWIVGGLVLILALLVVVTAIPAVQTAAARRLAAKYAGCPIEVGRLAVGFSSAEIRNLRVEKNGMVASVQGLEVEYRLLDFLLHKRVSVDRILVKGLVVDLRNAETAAAGAPAGAPTPAAQPAAVFGLLRPAELPYEVRVEKIDVQARALLSTQQSVEASIEGGGIEAGKVGKLGWKVDFSDSGAGAALHAAHASGTLQVQMTPGRRISSVAVDCTAAVEGPMLPPDRWKLIFTAEQPSPEADEICAAQLAVLRDGQTLPTGGVQVTFAKAGRELNGSWHVALGRDVLTPVLSGLGLPELAVDGAGKFSYQPASGKASASGSVEGRVSQLEKLGQEFAGVGPIGFRAAVDAEFADDVARVEKLDVNVTRDGGQALLDVVTSQALAFRLKDHRLLPGRPDSELARVSWQNVPLAWAQPFVKPVAIGGGTLAGALSVETDAMGSQVRVKALRAVTLEKVVLKDGERVLVDGLSLSLSPRLEAAGDKLSASIPDLKLRIPAGDSVDGEVTADIENLGAAPAVKFAAHLRERMVSVHRALLPFDPGVLDIESDIAGRLEGRTLRVENFSTTMRRGKSALLAQVATLQPLTVDLAAVRAAGAEPASPALRAAFGEIPAAWADTALPGAKLEGSLAGMSVEVTFPGGDDLSVKTVAPLTLRGIGLAMDGQALVKGIDADLDFSAGRQGDVFSGELRRLELRQGKTLLARMTADGKGRRGSRLEASAHVNLEADLAALGGQPVLAASFGVLGRGKATGTVEMSTGESINAKVAFALRELAARKGGQTFGDFDLGLDAAVRTDLSTGRISVPVALTAGKRKSDALFEGSFRRTDKTLSFDGKLSSQLIAVDDFMALTALAPQAPAAETKTAKTSEQPAAAVKSAPAAQAAAPTAVATAAATATTNAAAAESPAATESPWKGLSGAFVVDLKQITMGKDFDVSAIQGRITADDSRLAIDGLEGRMKKDAFKVSGALTFASGKEKPFALKASVKIPGFEIGEFLRAAKPGETPMLESKVAVDAQIEGEGADLNDLPLNTRGKVDVTGGKGVLRALGSKGEVASAASTVLGLISALKGSATTAASGELAGLLNEMKFDQFAVHAERGADLNIRMTSLEFISPIIHLTGTGTVTHQKKVSIMDQPLRVEMQLAGKDNMAVILSRLYLLGSETDAKGYSLMNSKFVVKGKVSQPDASEFWKIVGQASLKAAAGSFFGR